MYIAILGRQPALGIAELERLYEDVVWFSDASALVKRGTPDINRLGGSVKVGRVVAQLPLMPWKSVSQKVVQSYAEAWSGHEQKITLGITVYGFSLNPREVQKTGLVLKTKLKGSASLRLIPNSDTALSSATSHHNKLGLSDNKVELLIVRGKNGIIVAESTGSQNITAYTKRDQERPKRDAFVGMLPPKLAQIIVNLGTGNALQPGARVLDPFCGTGVVLQEASLMGYAAYGTDLSDKMIDFTNVNLEWLERTHKASVSLTTHQGDATTTKWQQPVDAVACESYLGQPFSAPPSPAKLREVRGNCNHIIGSFLRNIASQLQPGTPLCVAVPAWRDNAGTFTHLPLVNEIESLGYTFAPLKSAQKNDLLYYREDQVVARQLLVLMRK